MCSSYVCEPALLPTSCRREPQTVAMGQCATMTQACYVICDVAFKFTVTSTSSADELQDDVALFLPIGAKFSAMRIGNGKFSVALELEMSLADASNATLLAMQRAELVGRFAEIDAVIVDENLNTMTPIMIGTQSQAALTTLTDDNSTLSVIAS